MRTPLPRTTAPRWCSRTLLGFAACASFIGCASAYTTWKPVPESTLHPGEYEEFTRVLAVTRDGYEIELARASLTLDSLTGQATTDIQGRAKKGARLALARTDIARLETSVLSAKPTRNAIGSFIVGVWVGLAEGVRCVVTGMHACR